MKYIFDTSSIRTLQNFYPDNFPSIWDFIDEMINSGDFLSVREAYNELTKLGATKQFILDWATRNKQIFFVASSEETLFLSETLFINPGYRQLIRQKNIIKGFPVADPFVIASAKIREGTAVTEENYKENAHSIPNICESIGIPCINLQEFMNIQRWRF